MIGNISLSFQNLQPFLEQECTGISQITCRIILRERHFPIRPDFEHKVKTFSGIFSSFVWLGAITGQNSLQFLP